MADDTNDKGGGDSERSMNTELDDLIESQRKDYTPEN